MKGGHKETAAKTESPARKDRPMGLAAGVQAAGEALERSEADAAGCERIVMTKGGSCS